MWPLKTDKLLLSFLGKPLFFHILKTLSNLKSFNNIVIIANPENKEALEKIADELGLSVQMVVQKEAKGMADALLSAEKFVSGEIVITNADDLTEAKTYEKIIELSKKSNFDAIFTFHKVKEYFPGAYLKVEDGKILDIVEKPEIGKEPSNFVKLVVDYFKDGKKLISYLKKAKSDRDDNYETALTMFIKDNLTIGLSEYSGSWLALKYPWHILDLMEILLKQSSRRISIKANISKSAIIEGPTIIEDGVRILENAVIKGPCYIGKNSIIGTNSLIRESIVAENVVIGFGTEITRSYVGNNSWFHTNYVGDSVIEGNLGMGSGAVISNLRLDNKTIKTGENKLDTKREKLGVICGSGVRIGVNATTMPGVRIGTNSLIGPSVIINKDVEEKRKILLKQEYEKTENTVNTNYDKFRSKL